MFTYSNVTLEKLFNEEKKKKKKKSINLNLS